MDELKREGKKELGESTREAEGRKNRGMKINNRIDGRRERCRNEAAKEGG